MGGISLETVSRDIGTREITVDPTLYPRTLLEFAVRKRGGSRRKGVYEISISGNRKVSLPEGGNASLSS